MALSEHEAAQLKGHHDHRIETYKSMVSISIEMFKYLALLNGGATAGMLSTFATLQKSINTAALKQAVTCFVVGLLLNGLAVASAYFTQLELFEASIASPPRASRQRYFRVALTCAISSLVAFSIGAMLVVLGAHD
ncbi:MAG TPA: hypothetical protein VFG03_19725 [Telluria sp.]|nr:hypothetical protein [Telluria sp.]